MLGTAIVMSTVIIFLMAKKKESLWVQMTLSEKTAMAWLKPDTTMTVSRMEIGLIHKFESRFELPEWAAGSAKSVMVLTDKNPAKWPLFITSQPVIRALSYFAAAALKNGAIEGSKNGVIFVEFGDDNAPTFKFTKGSEKFAPYQVDEITEDV